MTNCRKVKRYPGKDLTREFRLSSPFLQKSSFLPAGPKAKDKCRSTFSGERTMKSGLRRAVLAIVFASVPGVVGVASAQNVIYEGGTQRSRVNAFSGAVLPRTFAMNFILPEPSTVFSATAYMQYKEPYLPRADQVHPAFIWTFLATDPNGLPGAVIASGTTTFNLAPAGPAQAFFSFPFSGVSLGANVRYWFALTNTDTASNTRLSSFPLEWQTVYDCPANARPAAGGTVGGAWGSLGLPNDPSACVDYFAFTLYGEPSATTTAPEPSSLALLGTGLIGLVPLARRRKG